MSNSGSSQAKVIANVQYFLDDIMNAARTKGNWSENTLKEAFKWAAYCKHAASQPALGPILVRILKSREINEDPIFLEKAEENLALELLINQKISPQVQTIVETLTEKSLGNAKFELLKERKLIIQENHQIVIDKLRCKETTQPLWDKVKIRFLVKTVELTSNWKQLNSLLSSPGVLGTLLEISKTFELSDREAFLRTVGLWLNDQLSSNQPNIKLFQQIVSVSEQNLCELCSLYEFFQEILLCSIEKIGKSISHGNEMICSKDDITTIMSKLKHPVLKQVTVDVTEKWFSSEDKVFWMSVLFGNC